MTQGVNYLVVPILIREDDCVRLHFPRDITMAEAEKVSRVILAYAVDAPSDSGSDPEGENSRSEVECEASQSGGEAASPKGGSHD